MIFSAAPVFAASHDPNKIILCVQEYEINEMIDDGVYFNKLLKGGTKKSFMKNPDNIDVVEDEDFLECMAMESEDDAAGEGGKMISPMAVALSGLCSSLMPVVSESDEYRLDDELRVFDFEWFDDMESKVIRNCIDRPNDQYRELVDGLCYYTHVLLRGDARYEGNSNSIEWKTRGAREQVIVLVAHWPMDSLSYQVFEQVDVDECG